MSRPVNQIGPFPFLSLDGEVVIPQQQLEIVRRVGVDGNGFWRTGTRGEPFQLQSACDTQTYADARLFAINYPLLSGGETVELVVGDFAYSMISLEFEVLRVDILQVIALVGGVGGLYPPSAGFVRAAWTLIAVPQEEV